MDKQEHGIKYSLRKKTSLLIVALILAFGTASVLIYNKGMKDIIQNRYEVEATNVTNTVAALIDVETVERFQQKLLEIYRGTEQKVTSDDWGSPAFEAYMAHFNDLSEDEDFLSLVTFLRRIQDVNTVDCLYIAGLDPENEMLYYIVDAAWEDACAPGTLDPIFDANREILSNPKRGFPPYITNTDAYGWLISCGAPVYNAEGQVVCYAFADISMNEVMDYQRSYLMIAIMAMAVLAFVGCMVGILIVQKAIIGPLRLLTNASAKYFKETGDLDYSFSEVRIKTGDEIELLADSMARMEQNVNEHITKLVTTTNELNEAQNRADEMDRQANVDALTKVRNKRAFETVLEKLEEELTGDTTLGFVMADMNNLKEVNDAYGHDKGDQAIQTACSLICSTFKHSAVFRIGGDEFVVILESLDYENRESLLSQLRMTQDQMLQNPDLEEWDRSNVAVGMAVYDPKTDQKLEDALHRADENMYADKRMYKISHSIPERRD